MSAAGSVQQRNSPREYFETSQPIASSVSKGETVSGEIVSKLNAEQFKEKLLLTSRFANLTNDGPDKIFEVFKQYLRIAPGVLAGGLLGSLVVMTGLETGVHEYVGHGQLGLHLTHNYPKGEGPRFQVDAWDNLKAVANAGSFWEGVKAFFHLLFGYDINQDGASGVTWHGNGEANSLGEAMGKDGLSAWVSIAGSIPTLITDTMLVAGGMKLKDIEPTTGYGLVALGLTQHMITSSYAWSAVAMSDAELIQRASSGHDFANFARRIGDITGASHKGIAIGTAAIWTSIVPAIAILMYMHQESQKVKFVPDHAALQDWITSKAKEGSFEEEILKYFKSYQRKEKLIESINAYVEGFGNENSKTAGRSLYVEMRRFSEHILNKMPSRTLRKHKYQVLKKWEKHFSPNPIQKTFSVLSLVGTISSVAIKILQILGDTIAPYLGTAATVLTYSSPLFSAVPIAASAYETFCDFKSTDKNVPQAAKWIGVAKLVVTAASAALITTALFLSGISVYIITALVALSVINLALSLAKTEVIKKRFQLLQSIEPSNWQVMYRLLEIYKQDKGHTNVKKSDRNYRGLHQWINHQKVANRYKFLDKSQVKQLSEMNVFQNDAKKLLSKFDIGSSIGSQPRNIPVYA